MELAKHGITDYWTLRYKTGVKFTKLDFGLFGKGLGFVNYFMNKEYKRPVATTDLDDLAKWCNWMPTDKQREKKYLEELKKHGIVDYKTLLNFGSTFYRLDFGIFGKGGRFLALILSDIDTSDTKVEHLITLATKMGWEAETNKNLELLAKHGITDYWTLLEYGLEKFQALEFKGLGGSKVLTGRVLGKTVYYVSSEILTELIDKLGWTPKPEEKKKKYAEMLSFHGINDYWTLRYKYSDAEFRSFEFPGIGKGRNFIISVLGKSEQFSTEIREELAAYMGWVPTEEQRIAKYKTELAKNGIFDCATLLKPQYREFIAMDFGIFGKGTNLLRVVLNKSIESIRSKGLLLELAKKLGYPNVDSFSEAAFLKGAAKKKSGFN